MALSIRKISGNVFWSLVTQLLSRGSIVLASMVLARMLDTEAFATFSYFHLTVSVLATYAVLGLGTSSSRFFAEIEHPMTPAQSHTVVAIVTISLLLGVFSLFIILVMPASWLSAGLDVPRILLGFGVFSLTLQAVVGGAMLGLEKYREAALISLVAAAIMLIGTVLAGIHSSPYFAMSAYIFGALIQIAGQAVIIGRHVGWARLCRVGTIDIVPFRRVLSLSGPVFATSLLASSGSWIVGRMILAGEEGAHEFVLFTIGLQWFALALLVPGVTSRVFLPAMVRAMKSDGAQATLRRLTLSGMAMAWAAAMLVALAGIAASPLLLSAYGTKHQIGGTLISAFLLAAIVSAPSNTVGNAIIAADGQWVWFGLTMAWLLTLVGAANFLIHLGAVGGALAYAAAYALLVLLALGVARLNRLI